MQPSEFPEDMPQEIKDFVEAARASGAEVQLMAVTQEMLDDLVPAAVDTFADYLQAVMTLMEEKPDVNEQDLTISLMEEFMAPSEVAVSSALVGNTLLAAVAVIQAAKRLREVQA